MELLIGEIIEKILELAGSGFERVSATLGWSQETQKLGCQVLVLLAGLRRRKSLDAKCSFFWQD
jgi:hypothetical protein